MTQSSRMRPNLLHAAVVLAGLGLAGCAGQEGDRAEAAAAPASAALAAATESTDAVTATITVYKSPTCACCQNWVEHLREHDFEVVTHDTRQLDPVKDRHGVPTALRSCHTALVGDYVIEGHVPADLIRRLIEEAPQVAGLAVPGMPMGSPGMEGLYSESYDVVAFRRDGSTEVYASR